jgi:hypothetical protein
LIKDDQDNDLSNEGGKKYGIGFDRLKKEGD